MDQILTTIASFAPSYWATLGVGALCAYLGIFTVLRRIVFTGAALAQAAAAGVAASFWLLTLPLPASLLALVSESGATIGSLCVAVGSALILARGERRGRLTADALVGAVFASSSALAVLLVWRSGLGLVELKNILAGDVLLSSSGDLRSLWLGVVGVAVLHAFKRQRFLLVAYDPAFARAQGLNVRALERAFLASLAVAVAVALRAAGLMLVFGTLVLPPLVGLRVGSTLTRATWVAVGAAWSSALGGFLLATRHDLPVAPTIVACEVALLGLAMLLPRAVEIASLAGGLAALALGLSLGAFAPSKTEPVHSGPTAFVQGTSFYDDYPEQELEERAEQVKDLSQPNQVRLDAAAWLGRSGKVEALAPLVEVLGDPLPDVADAAREAAMQLAAAPAGPARTSLLEHASGPDSVLATYAARLLVELEHRGAWSLLVERLADPSVPLLLLDDTHAFLRQANGGDGLGYDAFAGLEENDEALRAWRQWAQSQ